MRLLCRPALVQLGCNVKHVLRTTERLLDPNKNKKTEMRKQFFYSSQSEKIKSTKNKSRGGMFLY